MENVSFGIFIWILKLVLHKCSFVNITQTIFGLHDRGLLAAFADTNSDKNVDLLVLNATGKSINIHLNQNKRFVKLPELSLGALENETIFNVIPADFDGDSLQDLLLVNSNKSAPAGFSLNIYWFNGSLFDGPKFIDTVKDSPLIIDFNGDMLPDIYAEAYDDQIRYYWIFLENKFFRKIPVSTENLSPFTKYNSNSFVDLNKDLVPDIFVASLSSKPHIDQYEKWINMNGKYTRAEIYTSNVFWISNEEVNKHIEIIYTGHSVFTDINASGEMKHLCLVCIAFKKGSSSLCEDWAILTWLPPDHQIDKPHWEPLFMYDWERNSSHNNYMIDFDYAIPGTHWKFNPRLSVADFNIDGYPDVLLILTAEIEIRNEKTGRIERKIIRTPVLLENIPCGETTKDGLNPLLKPPTANIHHLHAYNCNHLGRRFRIMHPSITSDNNDPPYNTPTSILAENDYLVQDAVLGAFFDIHNDGLVDIILVRNVYEQLNANQPPIWKDFRMEAFRNNLELDASFVKILVLNGRCWMDCKFKYKPYGIVPPGAVIKYQTTYSKDAPTQAMSCQLMQTAHFSLNVPHVIFGLGMRPNFIDKLEVGFARASGQPSRYHSWTAIIPNSQMIIIPYPINDPTKWQHILLLTPSYFLLKIGTTLIVTCLFLAMIIGILQWKERKEDYYERLRNANQFHFDAL